MHNLIQRHHRIVGLRLVVTALDQRNPLLLDCVQICGLWLLACCRTSLTLNSHPARGEKRCSRD